MKYFILCFCLLTTVAVASAQESGELTVPLTNPGKTGSLDVDIRQGSIEVKGTNRQDVLIRYSQKIVKGASADNEETGGLKKYSSNTLDLDISEDENVVMINSDGWNNGADLYIEVPANFNATLDSYLGDLVSISNVSGEISLEGYTGNIKGTGISGFVSASTYSGDIQIDIISISDNKPMAFTNYSGDIDITFPANFKANLKLQTKWGDIYSSYDLEMDDSKPKLKKVEGEKRFKLVSDNWIYGKVNGGGPETLIKSTSGNIYIRKRK